jgi:hypothetical protein
MKNTRFTYFILFVITIILGLLSRRIAGIPLFIGDVLWATMVYWMLRFIFISRSTKFAILASLLFCYGIEFSQLYQAPWINNIRDTFIGELILGKVFLWGDMLSYTGGVAIGVLLEMLWGKPGKL